MTFNKKGFTLIELLIVIGIIAILAAGVIVVINPGRQFAQARDASRESHIKTLYNSILSYQVSNQGNLSGLSLPTEPTEICNTNLTSPTCTDLVDLSDLVAEGHLNQLPVDPQGGVSETSDGTGYEVAEGSIILVAPLAETRFIGIGTTESEYAGGGGATFVCGDGVDYGGYSYSTVNIGEQCWFAENLKTTQYSNGEEIPYAYDDNGSGDYCLE
jgi:type IV pilus assembly protein PilA